ncbi:MAG TPA: hypothetical protein GXX46_02005 [Peptococcaceae bacterium]|nr:hypothetical protein [Peptococcaceae bacterium]
MFEKAPRVREIAEKLIDDHHPHLRDAKDLIEYYIRDDGGVNWAGKCKKCSAFERFLTGKMFHIFVIAPAFEGWPMEKLRALIDHELCHIQRKTGIVVIDPTTGEITRKEWASKDDPENWLIREHDVEEFSDVIYRHGLWDTGIEKFAEAVRDAEYQMTLFDVQHEKELREAK